ncbi:putative cyclin-D1-binding protein [Helianthus annuus]|uniref:Cyclin-D1-binding protein n=1 Tax=Helianthus annuus TaxID=4232 RepID=A0A251S8G0_HELAN|nr:uncharacterized protein LOC110911487 [Helianthus annuus]KAF5764149.1 putative cyclin-D1-binding protein [Helianthus annuus]KAJ0455193.1 putative cyclin-D1-binding protein [Helianthus annuus]KAJ0472723.1 putative cyclin-D1-binding protein [Helianthus annuus]KAJ0648328.1 putative cyclin-D1-binding protein [Helianthus annuus]KAJ0652164.1 putative cyclin-D1-binding protein [Helianthus annuus]
MGKAEKERLNELLIQHLNTIHETFQVLDQSPPSSLQKVSWDEVIKLGEQLYKQATTVGMLWTGAGPDAKSLEESMGTYSNLLQGFLLLSHGSMIGAGTTLTSYIHASVKQVIDCSFMLLKESVASYGNNSKAHQLSIPQIVGTVWEACSSLKKTPGTNVTAIGRSMTQIAVSITDVLREMKELKPASSDPSDEVSKPDNDTRDSDNSSEGDLGTDLSPEDMKITELAIEVVSGTLLTIKETIRSITGLLKNPRTEKDSSQTVNSLEKLLDVWRNMGLQVDEIGACLYPPQEISAIKTASEKMVSFVGELQEQLEIVNGSSVAFVDASNGLKNSLKKLELGLGCSNDDEDDALVGEMKNLEIDSSCH